MTVITTSTAATATAYSNQRKIDRCQNGVLWAMFWDGTSNTTDSMHFRYSTDDGATWSDGGGFGFAGTGTTYTPNGSLFIDLDDYAHVVYRDPLTGYIYYRRGTPNAGRTAWTWTSAKQLCDTAILDYPDIVAFRDGTGWQAAMVASASVFSSNWAAFTRVSVASDGTLGAQQIDGLPSLTGATYPWGNSGGNYSARVHTYPSIDFNHTGDGKTVAGSAPHLYVAWSAGATGAGKGIRFKKATYSGGSWTWGTEREIDSTRYASNATVQWLNCLFDGTRVLIGGGLQGVSNTDLVLHERDAADTTTVSRVLLLNPEVAAARFSGSLTYDSEQNVYIVSRNVTPSVGNYSLTLQKWTRASATLGAEVLLDSTANTSPCVSAKRGYSGNRIEFVYTDGTASPYSVTYGGIRLALGATIGVTDETNAAQALARQKTKTASPSPETDAAQPVGKIKQVALGTVVETDTAVEITRRPRVFLAIGTATETDTAEPITRRPRVFVAIGTATETDAARPLAAQLVPVYYRFTPPTAVEKIRTDRLFSRYGVPVGQTVIKIDGVYTVTPYPWLGDLEGLKDGVDYFLGGRDYTVPSSVAADLTAAGYELVRVS